MRRLASAVVVIALASAGCIGSSNSSTSSGRLDDLGLMPLKTDLTITYTALTCPPGARCAIATNSSKHYRVNRQLLCSPSGGDYDNPAAVCRALNHVVKKLDARPATACLCPLQRPANAVGYYHGKQRTIPLNCLCIRGIGADIQLLLPGAQ